MRKAKIQLTEDEENSLVCALYTYREELKRQRRTQIMDDEIRFELGQIRRILKKLKRKLPKYL